MDDSFEYADLHPDPEDKDIQKKKADEKNHGESKEQIKYDKPAKHVLAGLFTHVDFEVYDDNQKSRRKGIASALLGFALESLDEKKDVTVSKFRNTDEKGTAARRLYMKSGFLPEELTTEFGYPCQVLRLHRSDSKPTRKKAAVHEDR